MPSFSFNRSDCGFRINIQSKIENPKLFIYIAVAISILLIILVAGCRSSSTPDIVITFWAMGTEGEQADTFLREFEKLHPGVRVELQTIPWSSAHDKLITAYAGRSTPDVCQLGNTWVTEFQAMNALAPLDSFVTLSNVVQKKNYFNGIWETNVIEGKLYGIPWYVDTRALFYRTDLLQEAAYSRPPDTWEEFSQIAKALTKDKDGDGKTDQYGIFLPVNPNLDPIVVFFIWQNGADVLKDNYLYPALQEPAVREAFEFYISFFRAGASPMETSQMTNFYQAFRDGYFAMFISGPWNVSEMSKRIPEIEGRWAVAPLPKRKGRDSWAGGSSLVVFESSERKAEAWKLIEFLSQVEIQRQFYKATFDLPAVKQAWADSVLFGNPKVQAFYQQLEFAHPAAKIPEWEQIIDKIGTWTERVIFDTRTLDEALEGMMQDINRILDKRRWLYAKQ